MLPSYSEFYAESMLSRLMAQGGVKLLGALRANTVREIKTAMVADESFYLIPMAAMIPYFLARATDGQ